MSVVESAVCVAYGQNEWIPSKKRFQDPRSRFQPRRGDAMVEEGSWVEEVGCDCEESYRMREINKQMPPLQPLLDLTLRALLNTVACMTQPNRVAKLNVDDLMNRRLVEEDL